MFAAAMGNYKLARTLVENGRADVNISETVRII